MTIDLKAVVTCDWPGCERTFMNGEVVCFEVRIEAHTHGWIQPSFLGGMAKGDIHTLDFCPIHPHHDGYYLEDQDSWRLHCVTCDWTDEDPVEPHPDASLIHWVAHLPPFTEQGDDTP